MPTIWFTEGRRSDVDYFWTVEAKAPKGCQTLEVADRGGSRLAFNHDTDQYELISQELHDQADDEGLIFTIHGTLQADGHGSQIVHGDWSHLTAEFVESQDTNEHLPDIMAEPVTS